MYIAWIIKRGPCLAGDYAGNHIVVNLLTLSRKCRRLWVNYPGSGLTPVPLDPSISTRQRHAVGEQRRGVSLHLCVPVSLECVEVRHILIISLLGSVIVLDE